MLQTIQHAHDVLTEKGLSPVYYEERTGIRLHCPIIFRDSYVDLLSELFPDMYCLDYYEGSECFHITPKEQLFQRVANVILTCVTDQHLEMAAAYAERSRYKDDPVISSLIAKKAAELNATIL